MGYHGKDTNPTPPMNAAPTAEFEYLAIPVTTTLSPVTLPATVRDYRAMNLQIQNTGGAALTSLVLTSKCHPNAIAVNHATQAGDWTVGSLIVDINGTPFTLAAGAVCNLIFNTLAQYQLILQATCAASTTLAVRGHVFGMGV